MASDNPDFFLSLVTFRMKRQFDPAEPELMDLPQPVTTELEVDLQNLRQLNRFFGGHGLVFRFLREWIRPGQSLRVLDLGTGSGDVPRLVVDHARSIGAKVEVAAVDQQTSTLEIAQRLSADYPEIIYRQGNILEWENDDAYDIVLCTLALHHFSEDDAVRLLRRCRKLSHGCVLVSDLRRGLLATLGVYFLTAVIFRAPMTRADGRASARRAFSFAELRSLAERAGWKNFQQGKFRFARQAIWMGRGEH
jgi:2-polyprenyl-3-methyl-5-hydroxy-6-metoxy-1,4-benzoquinol methylase